MAESFEKLDNNSRKWAKDKFRTSIFEALNWYEKRSLTEKRKMKPFPFSENGSDEKKSQGQSVVERD